MKRYLAMLSASLLLLASGSSLALAQQAEAVPPAPQRDQEKQPGMDSNSNAPAEIMRRQKDLHPGVKIAQRAQAGMMARGPMPQILFAVMDADGDGTLSLEELQDALARIFNHMDADDDGRVTPEEIRSFFRGASLGTGR